MRAANDNFPLYPDEKTVATMILGSGSSSRWDALATVLEREGLPRIDPMTGRRYWPAVRAFLDRRHGLTTSSVPAAADGAENWG